MTPGRPGGSDTPFMVAVSIGEATSYWSLGEAQRIANCLDQQMKMNEESISLMLRGSRYSLCREMASWMSKELRKVVLLLSQRRQSPPR